MLSEKEAWLYLAKIIETGSLDENEETKLCFLRISDKEEFDKLNNFEGYNKFCDKLHLGLCSLLRVCLQAKILGFETYGMLKNKINFFLDALKDDEIETHNKKTIEYLFPTTKEGWEKRLEFCKEMAKN